MIARIQRRGWIDPSVALAAYMAVAGEVDLTPLLQDVLAQGGTLWLPRFDAASRAYEMVSVRSLERDTVLGHYGIVEPCLGRPAIGRHDQQAPTVLWLVPGLAFDPAGHRLGHGKGYYDRLLAGTGGRKVGVAWDWQVLPSLPSSDHDVKMDWVVTEERAICCDPS